MGNTSKGKKYPVISVFKSELPPCHGAKDNKGFGFALSAWFIVPSVTSCFCGISLLLNALVVGNGSYILWPSMALTWGMTPPIPEY